MTTLPTRLLLLLAGGCLLAACGFHLRGTGEGTDLPDDWYSMYLVTGNPNAELSRELRARFAANGIQWTEQRDQANYLVRLGPERFTRRNLSINAEGRAAEFELTMRTQFSVDNGKGRTVMGTTSAAVVRQMENDPRNVVGKAEEIRILQGEMRTELSQQIMRQIAFFAASNR